MRDCENQKTFDTQACETHRREWDKHVQTHNRQNFHGARRMLQRSGEQLPWQPAVAVNEQPHDMPAPEIKRKNYFISIV